MVAAVLVRCPFTVTAVIVKIKHRRYCVNSQTVNMELFQPVKGVGNKEASHLGSAVIKNPCAPCKVVSLFRVCILVGSTAVPLKKSCFVSGEVSRYPVKDDCNSGIVEHLDHFHEIIRRSES